MKNGKLIKLITSITLSVGLAATLIAVPLCSYIPWKNNAEAVKQAAIESDNTTLKRIEAKLKEDVKVYNNNKASVTNEDFEVYAVYGGKYAPSVKQKLSPEDYTLTIPEAFKYEGGKVVVNYLGKSYDVEVKLIDIVLDHVEISEMPYKVTYGANELFEKLGMRIHAYYNDGSYTEIKDGDIVADTSTGLAMGTEKVSVSFTDDGITKSVDVPITVVGTLDNGEVSSMSVAEEYKIEDGTTLNDAGVSPTILVKYNKTQNRRILTSEEYDLVGGDATARLGQNYSVSAVLKANPNMKAVIPVTVSRKVEAESATGMVNAGAAWGKKEFVHKGGGVYEYAGTLDRIWTNGGAAHRGETIKIPLKVTMTAAGVARVILRSANPYYKNNTMNKMPLNHVMDLEVNGTVTTIPDSAVFKELPAYTSVTGIEQAPSNADVLYEVYYEYDLGLVYLNAGENTVQLNIHASKFGEISQWGESPCSVNIDYFRFETSNHEHSMEKIEATPATCTETGIKEHYTCTVCGANFSDQAGENFLADISTPALGHDFGEWEQTETKHKHTCRREGCGKSEEVEHTFELVKVDGGHKEECTVCGYQRDAEAETYFKVLSDKDVYYVGDTLRNVRVQEICECGDILRTVTCTVTVDGGAATSPLKLGSTVVVSYNDGEKDVTVTNPFPVYAKVEYENTTKGGTAGTNTKTIQKYRLAKDGTLIEEGTAVVGNDIMKTTKSEWDAGGVEKNITFTVNAAKAGKARISVDIANCFYNNYRMNDYNLGKVFALEVNGAPVAIPDTAIVPGFTPVDSSTQSAFDAAFQVFFLVDLGEIDLVAGENTITFRLNIQADAPYNEWSEIAGNKIDYFLIEMVSDDK